MTVHASLRIAGPWLATGGETALPYDFRVALPTHLAVWRRRGGGNDQLQYGIDYTVSGVGNPTGGSVHLVEGALAGDIHVLFGAQPNARGTDLLTQRSLSAALLNPEFDALQRQIQELRRDVGRSLGRSPFDAGDAAPLHLPPLEGGKFIGTDDDGNLVFKEAASGGGVGGSIPDPLPVDMGGTGANDASTARVNLDVMSQAEIVDAIAGAIGVFDDTLGELADLDTIATPQIDDDAVTLAKLAGGAPGRYIGFDEAGDPAALEPITQAKITALGRHSGGQGGLVREWVVDSSEVFAAGETPQAGANVAVDVPLKAAFSHVPAAPLRLRAGAGASFVIDANGIVFARGANGQGQLGLGDTTARSTYTRIEAFASFGIAIAEVYPASEAGGAQNYTMFLATSGKVYAAGANGNGQLGIGSTATQSTPVEVVALGSDIAGVAVSSNVNPHTLAWKTGGQLWAAGYNGVGQLGDGTTTQRTTAVSISGMTTVVGAACWSTTSSGYSVVRHANKNISAVGANASGQLGQGDTSNRSSFAGIASLDGLVEQIAVCATTVIARLTGGGVRTWGGGAAGQLGIGSTTAASAPQTPAGAFQGQAIDIQASGTAAAQDVFVLTATNVWWAGTMGGTTFAVVPGRADTIVEMSACGSSTTYGLSVLYANGAAAVLGDNTKGELGIGAAGADMLALTDVHLLNRSGQRGLQGDEGEKGDKGDKGDPGDPDELLYALTSRFAGNDFRDGSAGWTVNGATSATWDADGLVLSVVKASANFGTLRVFKTTALGEKTLTAGHRYALFADFDLEADQGVSAVATLLWRPFVLSSTPGAATVGKRLGVGALGSPLRHQVITSFIENATGAKGNPYVDISSPQDSAHQNLLTVDVTVTYRSFMLIDVGVEGDPLFDLPDDELANFIATIGTPYHPEPQGLVTASAVSGRTMTATRASYATDAGSAALATMADALRSPWQDKRIITLGHSLVSQVAWQNALRGYLSLEGYSVRGITGGTIQPKPGDGTPGFFSRSYMSGMLSSIINFIDAGAGGIVTNGLTTAIKNRTFATILWAGANDGITDHANSKYGTLYLRREHIADIAVRAAEMSVGDFADTAAGLASTAVAQYFSVAGGIAGWKILYEHRNVSGAIAQPIYHYPVPGAVYSADRIMTTDEQDEFENRNAADGASAFLSEPLSTGFVVTYEGLWHTLICNYLNATEFLDRPDHRMFIVREPQAFWRYDDTLDWPQGHYEKNEVHRRVADRWGIPLIDLWANSGINIGTRGMYMLEENGGDLFIHLGDKGGRQCARYIASEMLRHPPIDFTGTVTGSNLGIPTDAVDLGPWDPDNVV